MRSEPPTGDELTRLLVSMKRNVLEQAANEPPAAKRSRSTHRIVGLGLGVALLLGVGAGAAFALGIVPSPDDPGMSTSTSTSAPSSTPTPTATPTPTPSAEYEVVAGQPASRYGLDCETLVDPSLVTSLFTTEVAAADPIVTGAGVGIAIPRITSILSVGGTVCEWSNGVATNSQYGWDQDYAGVTVSVVPRTADGWSERANGYGMPADTSSCGDRACWSSAGIDDAWVSVLANGDSAYTLNVAAWQPFLDAVLDAVSTATPAEPASFPERTTFPDPADCEAVIPLAEVQSITSTPQADARLQGGGGWSEWAEARLHADEIGCTWAAGDTGVATVAWVHGGRWAYERMLLAGTAAPVELAGLSSGDAAVIRCDEDFGSNCAVDLAVGPDWFNVSGSDRDTAIALAEAMLTHSPK